MQDWKVPEISWIYLANGDQATACVNGISPEDGSGYVMVMGREIKVMPLLASWRGQWSELLTIKRNDGSTFEAILTPPQLIEKTAIIDHGDEEVHLLFDAGSWREMTDQELEKERRAWSADMAYMEQIKREWREYREG